MIHSLNLSCEGESHLSSGKVCQDYSSSYADGDTAIAIVSDGHGSDRYFRSDKGARLAVEISEKTIKKFISDISADIFKGKPLTGVGAVKCHNGGPFENVVEDSGPLINDFDKIFRRLFGSIYCQWCDEIRKDATSTPVSEWEKQHVDEKYIAQLQSQDGLEKIYGCTLMAFVRTSDYWFAFHIGDGKCVCIRDNGVGVEPIPWDDDCIFNNTTSLCDSNPIREFRYCYCGDGYFPAAVFLGSDGIDGSFPEQKDLVNFYVSCTKVALQKGVDKLKNELVESLPILSRQGSHDDMSIACVMDIEEIKRLKPKIIDWQKTYIESKLVSVQERLHNVNETIGGLKIKLADVERLNKVLETNEIEKRKLESKLSNWSGALDELNNELQEPVTPQPPEGENKNSILNRCRDLIVTLKMVMKMP